MLGAAGTLAIIIVSAGIIESVLVIAMAREKRTSLVLATVGAALEIEVALSPELH